MVDWPQANKGILSLAAAVDAILIAAQAAPSLATSQRGSYWTALIFLSFRQVVLKIYKASH
jgi:hypothetical protein